MKLSLAQLAAGTDKVANLRLVNEFAATAADAGADLIAFPEFTMYDKKVVDPSFRAAAEPLDGPFVDGVRAIAARSQSTIVVGVVERNPEGDRPYNTLVAVDPGGAIVARYRKIHLFDSFGFRESDCISPGDSLDPVTFTIEGITVGLMTCYDLRFPELGRALADSGAEVMLACSVWVPGPGKAEQWNVLARARAIENACYFAGVSQVPPVSIGRSLVVDPMGSVLLELGERPELATIDVASETVRAAREVNPSLMQRRYPRPLPAATARPRR